MFKKILIVVSLCFSMASVQAEQNPEESYQPDTYTKYDVDLEKDNIKISVFKVVRDEPHLNPLYFDLYFQCGQNKSFYKLKREFGEYEGEMTYCENKKPLVEEIQGKRYLSLPATVATPELGCVNKANRKEVFSIKEIVDYCERQSKN